MEPLTAPRSTAYLEVEGGRRLAGTVTIPGAKNAALPALVAASLSEEPSRIHNVPTGLTDVRVLTELLRSIGSTIEEEGEATLRCSGGGWSGPREVSPGATARLRASLYLLGAAAYWRAPMSLPMAGGCTLGHRRHDLHVLGLRELGFSVVEDGGGLRIEPGPAPAEARIDFAYPTFGGTLNVVFGALGIDGTTWIRNPARNPEVLDVFALLAGMGADLRWVAPDVLRVRGGRRLRGTEHRIMADRIVSATVLAATGVTRGATFLRHATTRVLEAEVAAWRAAGLRVEEAADGVEVHSVGRMTAHSIETGAYPGFHTDVQPLHAVMMVLATGRCVIRETILDGRFRYAAELRKLGGRIRVDDGDFLCVNGARGQVAEIEGVEGLRGADVEATDIRGGAAITIATLAAEGVSRVHHVHTLDRGYGDIAGLLSEIGARIHKRDPA